MVAIVVWVAFSSAELCALMLVWFGVGWVWVRLFVIWLGLVLICFPLCGLVWYLGFGVCVFLWWLGF